MNEREAFEEWFNSEMPMESLITDQDNDYKYQPAIASWEAWKAAIALQAQQPSEDQRAKLVANMIKYLGASKAQAKAIVDGVFDGEHTINESDLQSQAQQESKLHWCGTCEQNVERGCGDSACQYRYKLPPALEGGE